MKEANIVVIGGTIAAGKSTLVENLANETGWNAVPELREGDKIQTIILKKMYEGQRVHNATVQGYFTSSRYTQYKENYNKPVTSILDRGIWEDIFFATLWFGDDIKGLSHYKRLWKATTQRIIEKFGKPKAYVFVTVDWETFKERIYTRNRESEVQNFSKNKDFFKKLLEIYNSDFITSLKEFDIDPIILDTIKFKKKDTLNAAISELKNKGVL